MPDSIRRHRHRRRPGRLCHGHPRRSARVEDGGGRPRASRRHLPQLGLHPDESAFALRRDLPLHAARQGLRTLRARRLIRRGRGRAALARRVAAPRRRRRHAVEEEQGRRDLGRSDDRCAGEGFGQGDEACRTAERRTWAGLLSGQAHHHRYWREAPRPARARARWKAHLDLLRGDGAQGDAEVAARRGIGRHRHRVRLLLSHHGLRGDGRRSLAADPAGRGCRNRGARAQALREGRASRS